MPAPSATPASELIVEALGVTHHYGGPPVLSDVTFELRPGRVTAFLGRNGAGKSTTLAILAGLLQPVAGTVRVAGHDPTRHRATRGLIGYLPERPPIYPQATVEEHLDFAARLQGMTGRVRSTALARVQDQFELGEVRRRLAGQLSKGLQQRLGLAMAVVHSPRLVLLDEPGSGLDPVQLRRLRDAISGLGREAAVLYSTHMLNEALTVADDLMILCQGRLRHAGPTSALDEAPEPYLLALMSGEDVP